MAKSKFLPVCSACAKDIRGEPVTFTADGRTIHYHPQHAPTEAPRPETELDQLVRGSYARFVVILHVEPSARDLRTGRSLDRFAMRYDTLGQAVRWAERELADATSSATSAVVVDRDLRQGARGVVWRSAHASVPDERS